MIKRLTYILLATAALAAPAYSGASAAAAGDWTIHQTFPYNNQFTGIIDTKDRVFSLVRGQGLYNGAVGFEVPYNTLFVYDKGADEMLGYNHRNYLSELIIEAADYNPDKGYLLIVYRGGGIDLLYDDNRVVTIPGLKNASLTQSKTVNAISFHPATDRAYLATDFGYVEIDDKKAEIATSRIYNTKLTGACRIGDDFYISTPDKLMKAPVADRRQLLSDYTDVEGVEQKQILRVLPLGDSRLLINQYGDGTLYIATPDAGGKLSLRNIANSSLLSIYRTSDGYTASFRNEVGRINAQDGTYSSTSLPSDLQGLLSGTWDGREFWSISYKGLTSRKYDGATWTVTREAMRPNSPLSFMCEYLVPTTKWGVLANNHGVNQDFTTDWIESYNNLCGFKGGEWSNYAPVLTNPTYKDIALDTDGIAYDERYPDWVFLGSRGTGLTRLNLADPSDVRIYSRTGGSNNNLPGYTAFWPAGWAYAGAPSFDADGNLVVVFMQPPTGKQQLCVWPAADLKAGNTDGMKFIPTPNFSFNWKQHSRAMRHSSNRNIIVGTDGSWDGPMMLLDHKGTLDNPDDDVCVVLDKIYDNTGAQLSKIAFYDFYEDPRTGLLWVGTSEGVFTFYPHEMAKGKHTVQRVKVSRNDGTNLADYLLDGVGVYKITADSQGRKWFATKGGGILWTNASGTEILGQYTTDNSYLPDNTVYSIAFDPATSSLIMSTTYGISQFFPPGSGNAASDGKEELKIYPNPVRPDYLGWITIEGAHNNGIVKILDAAGSLVAELRSENGICRWDGTNLDHKRVRSGVYFAVASSSSSDDDKGVRRGKIVLVN